MTPTQRKLLDTMRQSNQVYHVVARRTVDPMIRDGLLRQVVVQPAPPSHRIAVALTIRGRGKLTPVSA